MAQKVSGSLAERGDRVCRAYMRRQKEGNTARWHVRDLLMPRAFCDKEVAANVRGRPKAVLRLDVWFGSILLGILWCLTISRAGVTK